MTDRLHVIVTGRVQGVGFRYSTYDKAVSLGLNGWVRNVPDGGVEAEFEGSKEALDIMMAWCRRGPTLAHVRDVEVSWDSSPAPLYDDFHIKGW